MHGIEISALGIDRAIAGGGGEGLQVDILIYCCTQVPQVSLNRVLCTCTAGILEHRGWI